MKRRTRAKHRVPLGAGELRELLAAFKKTIVKAGLYRRVFRLRYRGVEYRASLTSYGRVLVRDSAGLIVVATEYGWTFGIVA